MAAFTRSELHVADGFVLFEFDSTGEEGDVEASIPLFDTTSAVVLLLEGKGVDVEARLDNEELVEPRGPRVIVRLVGPRARELFVRARASVGASFKLSVLVVQRILRAAWARLSCPACRRFVRFLLAALLAALGVPDLSVDSLVLEEDWQHLVDLVQAPPESAPRVVRDLLGQLEPAFVAALVGALRRLLRLINPIGRILDAVSTRVCEELHICQPVPR